MNNNRKI